MEVCVRCSPFQPTRMPLKEKTTAIPNLVYLLAVQCLGLSLRRTRQAKEASGMPPAPVQRTVAGMCHRGVRACERRYIVSRTTLAPCDASCPDSVAHVVTLHLMPGHRHPAAHALHILPDPHIPSCNIHIYHPATSTYTILQHPHTPSCHIRTYHPASCNGVPMPNSR